MRRTRFLALAGMLVALTLSAAPVAANDIVRFSDAHVIDATYTCGVVEHTLGSFEGAAYFDADGNWVKDIIQFRYRASFTDPVTSETISYRTRQVVEATPGTLTLIGQGFFIRAPGQGTLLLDVGRLVIDPADGSAVFASAKVLGFEDPTIGATIDAAVCSLF